MVDENVPAAPVAHHLEVAGVLVDVEDDPDVLLGDHPLEVDHLAHVGDRDRAFLDQLHSAAGGAAEDDDGPRLGELGERFVPLPHLVQVHRAIREVHGDLEGMGGQRAAHGEALGENPLGLAGTEHILHQLCCESDVFAAYHRSSLPTEVGPKA